MTRIDARHTAGLVTEAAPAPVGCTLAGSHQRRLETADVLVAASPSGQWAVVAADRWKQPATERMTAVFSESRDVSAASRPRAVR